MLRRNHIAAVLSISIAWITPASAEDAVLIEEPTPPNVILITSDQLGHDAFAAETLSPFQHLSRLHSQSHQFLNHYIAPAVPLNQASIHTGRYNIRTKTVDYGYGRAMMAGDEVTIAEIFTGTDYKSGFFGTWWLGNNFPMRPKDQGYTESLVQYNDFIPPHSQAPGSENLSFGFRNNAEATLGDDAPHHLTTQAASFIESTHQLDYPFFLSLNIHTPVDPEAQAPARQQLLSGLDRSLSVIFAKLDELKMTSNTVIVFTTTRSLSNADSQSELRGTQGSVYEAGVRAPLWIMLPQPPQSSRSPKQIETVSAQIDILPTILEFCQFGSLDAFALDGQSLIGAINSAVPIELDRIIVQQHHLGATVASRHHFMLRKGPWKLLNPSDPSQSRRNSSNYELYNLSTDPSESKNLASENKDQVKQLLDLYDAWFLDVADTRIRDRGISPILVSRPQENPLILMADTRISNTSSSDGFWKLQAEHPSRVDISFDLPPHEGTDLKSWVATLSLRDASYTQVIDTSTDHVHFTGIPLIKGRNILQVVINSPDGQSELHPQQVHLTHR
ncbi:sulfatase-like hydrolase/transferase [Rubritalea marina]|uniref:sulfatase-like hydrolase/transferase n=1 Tax=Rubritalea marina TaxID=361055 RepID=UPI001969E83B|nr:sulfatase-like hydrolase/transferase [Rubritalea marina]